jgi:PAS domain S-box-containing protein
VVSTYSILYVDDEPPLLEIGKLFLEQGGRFIVETVTSAPAALALLNTKAYDAIVSDYQMPEMDGIEFLKNVRSSGNTIPFILFTGRGREEVVIEAINNGADSYIQKGGEPRAQFTDLAQKITVTVERRRAIRALVESEAILAKNRDYLNTIFTSVTAGILLIDAHTHEVIDVNPAAARMIGESREEITGRICHGYICPAEQGRCPITDISQNVDNSEKILLTASGKRIPIIKYATRVVVNDRDCLLETFIDNTERKRAETELRAALEQITAAEEELRSQYNELALSEKLIRENEENFQSLVENAPDAVFILVGRTFAYVNPAMARLMGAASPDQLLGMSIYDRIHPSFREKIRERARIVIDEGKPVGLSETVYLKLDGTPVDIESAVAPFRYHDKPAGLVILRDIALRKQVVSTLQERTSQIQALIENLPFDVWAMDRSGRYILQNPASITHWGNSIGKNAGDIPLPPDLFLHWMENNKKAFDGHVVKGELSVPAKDGLRTYEETIAPVRIGDEVNGIIGVNIDITERKQAEEALRESENRYRRLVETTGTGYVILDKDGRVISANEEYVRLTGRSTLAEIEGKAVTAWTAPYDLKKNATEVEHCIRTGQTRDFEIDYQKPDGSIQPIEVNASVVSSGTGPIILTLCRDITERKRTDKAFRQANRKLNLLSGITRHDINNQMTELLAYLILLEKTQNDPSSQDYLHKAENAARRISTIIRFTKEYEAIGVNAPVWQDIHTLVDTTATQVSPGTVVVKNDLPAGTEVFADPLISRVFYNLLENAVRYGEKITAIRFFVEERDGDHVVVCEDDGVGIAGDEKEKIFEKGFGKNSGLGLFLTREILDITGITIRETGVPGKGARFEITVPKDAYRIAISP